MSEDLCHQRQGDVKQPLGKCYVECREKEWSEAIEWFSVAEDLGLECADDKSKRLGKR